LIALNRLDKTALIAEIKRNPQKINLKGLEEKVKTIKNELSAYHIELKSYSMEDM